MESLFSQLCCCFQREPLIDIRVEPPDEQSHLIPATSESTSATMDEGLVIDHRKLKERMSSIVRSKEGKMVNVNARLPFNLHNKKLSATIDASSSGSRSGSSNRLSPLSQPSRSHERIKGHIGAPLEPVSHRPLSRDSSTPDSREPSVHESVSSSRTPILNARLVKTLPAGTAGIAARRGRARRKGGESTSIGSATGIREESVPVNIGLPSSDGTVADNTPRAKDFCLGSAETIEPMVSVSPASTVDFIIQDTGPLTVTWGD